MRRDLQSTNKDARIVGLNALIVEGSIARESPASRRLAFTSSISDDSHSEVK